MSKKPAPKKCENCGKSPELFWMAVDSKVFCNVACYAEWSAKEAKGVKRFESKESE